MAPLERDSGTATARYAMHISWLPAKPCVILRPRGPVRSYVQLNEAFSPAGTRTGASSHFQLFVTFPWRQTDTSPAVRQFKSPLEWVWRRSPRTRTCVEERLRTRARTPKLFPALTSTSRLNLKHLCARTATVVAPAGAWSVSPLMKDRGNARIIVAARWAAVNVAVWTSMSILLAGRNEDAVDSR